MPDERPVHEIVADIVKAEGKKREAEEHLNWCNRQMMALRLERAKRVCPYKVGDIIEAGYKKPLQVLAILMPRWVWSAKDNTYDLECAELKKDGTASKNIRRVEASTIKDRLPDRA